MMGRKIMGETGIKPIVIETSYEKSTIN